MAFASFSHFRKDDKQSCTSRAFCRILACMAVADEWTACELVIVADDGLHLANPAYNEFVKTSVQIRVQDETVHICCDRVRSAKVGTSYCPSVGNFHVRLIACVTTTGLVSCPPKPEIQHRVRYSRGPEDRAPYNNPRCGVTNRGVSSESVKEWCLHEQFRPCPVLPPPICN